MMNTEKKIQKWGWRQSFPKWGWHSYTWLQPT